MADNDDANEGGSAPAEPEGSAGGTPEGGGEVDVEKMQAALKKANKEAEKHRLRNKELEPLAQRVKEAEEADKTETEKLRGQLDEVSSTATQAQRELWRERAARKHGLDEELLEFLTGESEDEVAQRAETLAGKLTAKREAESAPDRRPDPSQGAGSGTGGTPSLQEQIRQAEQSGDIAKSLSLKNQLLTEQQK